MSLEKIVWTLPVFTPAVYNYDGVKMRHLISYEWCLFPQNWFQCFEVECLIVLIIKKKYGNSRTSRKY